MHIILGATGHIGSALTKILLSSGEAVTAVSRDRERGRSLEREGARVAVVDLHDVEAFRRVLSAGDRLFLLNPPADPSTDTVRGEKETLHAILSALEGAGLERVVAESVMGARPAEGMGDLGVLHEMEEALRDRPTPTAIIRGSYYMSNWDAALASARDEGEVPTFYPPELELPMVAPKDIARLAARLLTAPEPDTGLHPIEGPRRYSSADVARAFSSSLGKPVRAVETPPDQWKDALLAMGFSEKAAESFVAMTAATVRGPFPDPSTVTKGITTLQSYIDELVRGAA